MDSTTETELVLDCYRRYELKTLWDLSMVYYKELYGILFSPHFVFFDSLEENSIAEHCSVLFYSTLELLDWAITQPGVTVFLGEICQETDHKSTRNESKCNSMSFVTWTLFSSFRYLNPSKGVNLALNVSTIS